MPTDDELQRLIREIEENHPELWEFIKPLVDLFLKHLGTNIDPEMRRRLLALLAAIATWVQRARGSVPAEIERLIARLRRLLPGPAGEGAAAEGAGGAAEGGAAVEGAAAAEGTAATGGTAAVEGGGAGGSLFLGPLIAVIAGLALGGYFGVSCDRAGAKSAALYSPGRADPACKDANGIKPSLPVTGSYWGCESSLSNTLDHAEQSCTNHACSGSCSSGGGSCRPSAVVESIHQTPGWFSCDTLIEFHCECGCK